MTEARQVEQHKPLVVSEALKLIRTLPGLEMDDLVAAGSIGLLEAIRKYDPAKGTKFSTYAVIRIRSHILAEIRRSRLIYVPDGSKTPWNDCGQIGQSLDSGEYTEERGIPCGALDSLLEDEVYSFIFTLPEREKKIFEFVDVGGLTFEEVAGILCVTKQRVHQIHARAVEKIKRFFENGIRVAIAA